MDQVGLIDIYRTFHLKTINFTFFSSAHGTFSRIDHILGNKSSLGKFKKIEIIPVIFSFFFFNLTYLIFLPILFYFIFIYFYQFEANYFTILQWVLSYIDMNQPWSYMCSPSRSLLPPPSLPDPSGSSQCTRPEHMSHVSNLGW